MLKCNPFKHDAIAIFEPHSLMPQWRMRRKLKLKTIKSLLTQQKYSE